MSQPSTQQKNNIKKTTKKKIKRARHNISSSSDSEPDWVESDKSTKKKYAFLKASSSDSDIEMESEHDEIDKLLGKKYYFTFFDLL